MAHGVYSKDPWGVFKDDNQNLEELGFTYDNCLGQHVESEIMLFRRHAGFCKPTGEFGCLV